ncbi:perivitellin-2 67 kDa subunit-like [Physella acuta]|uniref:perivitellin-2 67 kDa subunit-like n=1 Tax=Physella acuta TaxID=109671 RepID=UPI0027DDF128|nr:perivitellin-2 67 kDa subunit-like [Physella acuta]
MLKSILVVFAVAVSVCGAFSREKRGDVDSAWFVSNTKLCLRWSGTFDSYQCGGRNVSENLCANVNQMTPFYHDWTDWRIGGCKMQWGIISSASNPPDWLSKVKMCYQWYAESDAAQCGGDAGKTYCADVNKYTTEYLDDTTKRDGGCMMRWMIQVPDSSPTWMKGVQMCFNWEADGDAAQCGGTAPLSQCVKANSWTEYYRDKTDDRRGGCMMSWGLKTSN